MVEFHSSVEEKHWVRIFCAYINAGWAEESAAEMADDALKLVRRRYSK
jgi:hypothetical protein